MKLPRETDEVVNVCEPTERDPRVYKPNAAFRTVPHMTDRELAFEHRRKFYQAESEKSE